MIDQPEESTGRKVVVLGGDGMLGQAFTKHLRTSERDFVAYSRKEVDLTQSTTLEPAIRGSSVVFNCAAYTNVDAAETDEDRATLVNGTAVGELARICKAAGVPLVHFSTDYVFDGRGSSPYGLFHPRAPLGAYGRSKALGEELLESSQAEYLLIRTSWVYAAWGQNFARTMSRLLRTRPSVQVVHDQRGRPSEALALARNALRLFETGARGVFHLTDGGECSWFEFAQAIGKAVGSSAEVRPCSTEEFPRPAPRPSYSVLDTQAAEERIGPLVSYLDQLEQMADALREA